MSAKPYACATWPRPTPESTYLVQDGYIDIEDGHGNLWRTPKWKRIPVFSAHMGCQYDKTATDPACSTCQHNPAQ